MSFLCVPKLEAGARGAGPKKGKGEFVKGVENVSSGTVLTEAALQVHVGSDAILPTFTCKIGERMVRAMKDSGCQPNFIETRIAVELNLPIVSKDVTITVNGFNESQHYLTNVVQVNLKVGDSTKTLNAVCVPRIKTRLDLPGLGVIVAAFVAKGYRLADEYLNDASKGISDLGFVLGTNDPDVLLENQIKFGGPVSSVFSETVAGVLLLGNAKRLLDNLSQLPSRVNAGHAGGQLESEGSPVDFLAEVSNSVNSGGPPGGDGTDFGDATTFAVLNDRGEIDDTKLAEATREVLSNYDRSIYSEPRVEDESSTELNGKLIKFVLAETTRTQDGRLIMPLTWRGEVSHKLARNLDLSKCILSSNLRKLQKNSEYLKMMDDVFRDQESQGIIERIEDLPTFLSEHPFASFLPHMGVFKLDRATTKCRVVFLSNLAERGLLSHNQVIHAGPSLNQKITTAILNLRFGSKLLVYDLKKAFLQIQLREIDSSRLLFLWFKNVEAGDLSVVAYRNNRLSFGLRCSPTVLMLGLYKLLCLDVENDDPKMKAFKKQLYALIYMDNGAVSGNVDEVQWAYQNLASVFAPYKFEVQQVVTNETTVQNIVDAETGDSTPEEVKLLGLNWHRKNDTLSTMPLQLDSEANTKRAVLASIAKQYDVFGFQSPCINRARLFMHGLQCNTNLGWDTRLDDRSLREWKKIVRQANASPAPQFDRYIGDRSETYKLIAYTDASKNIYAAVVYIQSLVSGSVNLMMSKSRIVNRQLELKSIPSLELQAVILGVELLFDLREELCGQKCLLPLKISEMQLFTDSMICLHWLNGYSNQFDKMQKKPVFVMNRLESIVRQCTNFPITFRFVASGENPADCASRPVSYKQLMKSSFFRGPSSLRETGISRPGEFPNFELRVPSQIARITNDQNLFEVTEMQATSGTKSEVEHLIPLDNCSSFHKFVRVQMRVLQFINKLKQRLRVRDPERYQGLVCYGDGVNLFDVSCKKVLVTEQMIHYPEIVAFLSATGNKVKDIPPLVNRLNLFRDADGLLKVKSKFGRWKRDQNFCCPILLPKQSNLTKMIIRDAHVKSAHSGCYSLLTSLRRKFWVLNFFSTVKRVLRECVICRRLNARPVKLNQSPYRDFRVMPPSEPFKFLFMDYLGPITTKTPTKSKVWLLCLTCLWSRAVNLVICPDLSVKSFLRAFQIHVFQQGMPSKVFSDSGSQLVAGAKLITDLLNNVEAQTFLAENGVCSVKFHQYFKGNSSLGSLVEVCVKFVKRLMFGAIGNNVLNYPDLELLIAQTVHLVNKRPVAFKEALRENNSCDVPEPITPELLLRGRNLISIDVLPRHSVDSLDDPDFCNDLGSAEMLKREFLKISKVRDKLVDLYNDQFLQTLVDQAVCIKDRYKPVKHIRIGVGDIVLLKEQHMKVYYYPMAIVRKVFVNEMGEVTDVEVLKGKTRELVKRHVSSTIPLLSCDELGTSPSVAPLTEDFSRLAKPRGVPKRKAAAKSEILTKKLVGANAV